MDDENEQFAIDSYVNFRDNFIELLHDRDTLNAVSMLETAIVECLAILTPSNRRYVMSDLLKKFRIIGNEIYEDYDDLISRLEEARVNE
jgi:hypothetical protein